MVCSKGNGYPAAHPQVHRQHDNLFVGPNERHRGPNYARCIWASSPPRVHWKAYTRHEIYSGWRQALRGSFVLLRVPEFRAMPFYSTKRGERFCIGSVTVHILATCRKAELLPATLMVFQSLRVGFPTAKVMVQINAFPRDFVPYSEMLIRKSVEVELEKMGGKWETVPANATTHHEWICSLIEKEKEPFFICDTDICLWSNFECFDFTGAALAGRYVPQFYCNFTKAITRPRLHGCLLYIDPVKVKSKAEEYGNQFPDCYATPRPTLQDLVFPRYVPCGPMGKVSFYDTCSVLYCAIGGQKFTDEQNLVFDHLQSGTLSDLVAPTYPSGNMREWHAAVLDQPHLIKGQWERDKAFYKSAYAE